MYSYSDAGFDDFFSRSVDGLSQANLDSQGPQTTAIKYDSAQISGRVSDTIQLGTSIRLSGVDENIVLNDGNNDRLLIGRQDGGF